MQIGEAGIEEPMWVHLSFMRRAQRERWFTEHPIGVRELEQMSGKAMAQGFFPANSATCPRRFLKRAIAPHCFTKTGAPASRWSSSTVGL
jgi:hypothetical protein